MAQILYKFTINLTKTSICLLYLRIFPSVKFRRTVYAVMTSVLLYAVASIVATIVQCSPLERIWNASVQGTCINFTAFWYANATANIVGDFAILGLPMPVVRSLHLPQRQRLGLMVVFALGGLYVPLPSPTMCLFSQSSSVCVTSILRMTTLDNSSRARDQTYGTLTSTVWTAIEANTGIICACLPMLKSPLATLFPRLFPRGSNEQYSAGSGTDRPRIPSSQNRNSPAAYGGWGRLQNKKQPRMLRISTSGDQAPAVNRSSEHSSNDTFGMDYKDVPMGHISKTTHVNVQYGKDKCHPAYSPTSKEHVRSLSEAHLVGKDFSFP